MIKDCTFTGMKVHANTGKIQQDTCPAMGKPEVLKYFTHSACQIVTSGICFQVFRDTLLLTLK